MADVEVGTELPQVTVTSTLATSVQYAGASGDLNPLHWDSDVAAGISPTGDVIAHGMYSMGLASRVLTGWAGGPEAVQEVTVRFTRPWPVGEDATFGGTVTKLEDGTATVRLTGQVGDTTILRGTGRVTLEP